MKKILIIAIAVATVLGYTVMAKADSVNATVPLSFTVPTLFGFTLEKYSADFGTIQPGNVGGTNTGIYCRSNHGIAWHMSLNADPFTNGTVTIPNNPNFTYGAWTGTDAEKALGTFNPTSGSAVVPTTAGTFYTSTTAEGSDPFVPLTLGVGIAVPAGQPAGLYETNLVLTMSE